MCCEATITKRAVAWVGSVQPECTVPLSTWNFRNFKPEFFVEWKATLMKPLVRTSFLGTRPSYFPSLGRPFFCTDDRKPNLWLGFAGQPSKYSRNILNILYSKFMSFALYIFCTAQIYTLHVPLSLNIWLSLVKSVSVLLASFAFKRKE